MSNPDRELDRFLQGVEHRAFVMAEVATRNPEEALDLVQDSMMAFANRYSDKRREDWEPLFYRVLQNRIRDWYRRSKVRNRWRGWLQHSTDTEGQEQDPLQQVGDPHDRGPERMVVNQDAGTALVEAVKGLPLRQQQAFMLRTWEGLDVTATAAAMGCSPGSVKTHLSRALHSLRQRLEGYWP